MSDPLPTYVFQDVSADLFQHGSLHVLVYADRLSGWPVVHQWWRDPTAREVVQAVVSNFVELGVPMPIQRWNFPGRSAAMGGGMGQFDATLPPKQRACGSGGESGKGVGRWSTYHRTPSSPD
jgi:hypothetical protein